MATWPEAIKALFLALPGIAWIAKWFIRRKEKKENKDAQDKAADAVAGSDPDRLGSELRDRMQR